MSEGTCKVSGKGDNKVITVKKGAETVKYSKGDQVRFPGQAPDKYQIIEIKTDTFFAGVVRTEGGYADYMPLCVLYPMGVLKKIPPEEAAKAAAAVKSAKSPRKKRNKHKRNKHKRNKDKRNRDKRKKTKRKK
jgi:hypothetical protein